jgi:hypothetical protein
MSTPETVAEAAALPAASWELSVKMYVSSANGSSPPAATDATWPLSGERITETRGMVRGRRVGCEGGDVMGGSPAAHVLQRVGEGERVRVGSGAGRLHGERDSAVGRRLAQHVGEAKGAADVALRGGAAVSAAQPVDSGCTAVGDVSVRLRVTVSTVTLQHCPAPA